jgi:acetyl-CoA carboxylase carboxyl transferase subunit alpha
MEFLDFEKPIIELERRIEELKILASREDSSVELDDEIEKLNLKCNTLTNNIFSDLSEWQIAQLSRHPKRPKAVNVINAISDNFQELHGDRMFADDPAIVSGLATRKDVSVLFIAQQKGDNTNDKIFRNYGMPKPEGYRKALRMMKLAEKFCIPIITIIDTPGAYPGIGAEERGQSEAIARNLFTLASLRTPVINLVIGEGGSGGALAIGMGDSPEACSSILWRNQEQTNAAAEAMGISSKSLSKLGLVDKIIEEPLGGFHKDPEKTYEEIAKQVTQTINYLKTIEMDDLLNKRRVKYKEIGDFKEI